MRLRRSADCRYQGQSFELTVPVADGPIDAGTLAALAEAFGQEHERTYGHRAGAEEPVEIVSLRVVAQGISDRPRVPETIRIDRPGGGDRPTRRVYFGPGLGWRETPILDRPALATPRVGPCIIEEYDATCVVPPGARATLDALRQHRHRAGTGDLTGEGPGVNDDEKPRDPIGFELFKNTLLSIADEMALTILRTAYSGVLKDNMDYSTAFCDGERADHRAGPDACPAHLSSFPDALAATIARFGDRMQPGDVYCLNDPFEGGMHIPDVFVLKPIFHEGERLAFAATICHQTDMGGRVAGSNASDSTEIYQEGLRIPPGEDVRRRRAERDAVPAAREEHPHAGAGLRRPARAARRLPHRGGGLPPSGGPPRRQAGPGVHGRDPRLHRAADASGARRAARRRMVVRGLDRR